MCRHLEEVKHGELKLVSEQKKAAELAHSIQSCKESLQEKETRCNNLEMLLEKAYNEV